MKKSASKRFDMLYSMAKQQSRPQIEKNLAKARKEYMDAQNDLRVYNNELTVVQAKVNNAQARLNEARQRLLDHSQFIQTMDLTGATGVRHRGDNVNFIMDGKEYHVDMTAPDKVHFLPWKEYKKLLEQEQAPDIEDALFEEAANYDEDDDEEEEDYDDEDDDD